MRGGVIAIGNFDGVHRGHRAVLDRALELAEARGVPALVLTFEPHPRSVFRPETPVFRLTPAPLKARILEAIGFRSVIEYPSTASFRSARRKSSSIPFWSTGWAPAPSSPALISISARAAKVARHF